MHHDGTNRLLGCSESHFATSRPVPGSTQSPFTPAMNSRSWSREIIATSSNSSDFMKSIMAFDTSKKVTRRSGNLFANRPVMATRRSRLSSRIRARILIRFGPSPSRSHGRSMSSLSIFRLYHQCASQAHPAIGRLANANPNSVLFASGCVPSPTECRTEFNVRRVAWAPTRQTVEICGPFAILANWRDPAFAPADVSLHVPLSPGSPATNDPTRFLPIRHHGRRQLDGPGPGRARAWRTWSHHCGRRKAKDRSRRSPGSASSTREFLVRSRSSRNGMTPG